MPIGIKSGWGQYFVITITGGHENQYHCRYRDIVVPMILTTDSYTVASFPGSCGGGGKRAWYTLFAHAQFPQEFCGFGTSQILRCNIILSMIILSSVTLVWDVHVWWSRVFEAEARASAGYLPCLWWKRCFCGGLQGFASRCVTRRSPLCSTTRNKAVPAVVLLTVV